MKYLQVKNWDQFQQYKDRDPKWIKLHRDVLDNYEFDGLTEIQQCHVVKIWLLAAKLGNKIPFDPKWIARKIGAQSKVDLDQLVTSGFLVPYKSVQDCTETYLEEEREREEEKKERGASDDSPPADKKTKPKAKAERLPEDFPTDDDLLWATQEFPGVDHNRESAKFRDYWIAVPGQKGCKLDWPATWRNWIRRCAENTPKAEINGPRARVLQ